MNQQQLLQQHHQPINIGLPAPTNLPIQFTYMQPPIDQFKTIFSIDNIKYAIQENNNLVKENSDAMGSHALFIKKSKAYKYQDINLQVPKSIHPIELLLVFIPIINIFYFSIRARNIANNRLEKNKINGMMKLYNDSFITMKYNVNSIITSPDAHKISKEESDALHKLIKYNEVLHFASTQLLFNKDIIKCYKNFKNNKITKNSDDLCGESIKFEEMEERVNAIIKKFGSIIIAESENNYKKINDYFDSIINLKKCIAYNYHHSKFYNIFNKNQLQNFYEEISFILCIANIILQKDDSDYTFGSSFNKSITRKTSSFRKSSRSSRSSRTGRSSKTSITGRSKRSKRSKV